MFADDTEYRVLGCLCAGAGGGGTAANGILRPSCWRVAMPSRKSRTEPSCGSIAAMALPASMALPPPMPITQSGHCARKSAATASTKSGDGSPRNETTSTWIFSAAKPCSNRAQCGEARNEVVPVTSRTRPQLRCSKAGSCASLPGPKWICGVWEKMKLVFMADLTVDVFCFSCLVDCRCVWIRAQSVASVRRGCAVSPSASQPRIPVGKTSMTACAASCVGNSANMQAPEPVIRAAPK